MKVLGLTGGVGMGKSTAAKILIGRDVPVIDTDALAHELVKPGQPSLEEIVALFGGQIIDQQGQLRRDELARIVFSDAESRRRLENILHPRIRDAWLKQVEEWRAAAKPLVAVVIPLLFETKAESRFDATICVACSAQTQSQRLVERGWNEKQIGQRIEAQFPVEKKMLLSDHVVWTEGSVEVHAQQLDRIMAMVMG